MRFTTRILLSLISLPATFAFAQTLPHFDHIIIVVQENRTPDNLFGSNPSIARCNSENPFEPGVDIEDGGKVKGQTQLQCFIPLPLSGWDANLNGGKIVDPGHGYPNWTADYDGGQMDGFCQLFGGTNCPEYSYVQKSDVQPYFDIATNYGFANYMFQTNQGPSFPAHQFLFSGTSAPVAPHDSNSYYLDFVTGNANFLDSGCPYTGSGGWPGWVYPDGTGPHNDPRNSECYPHDRLVTDAADCTNGNHHCDRGLVSWYYYTRELSVAQQYMIWDAPAAIPEVCYGSEANLGTTCGGSEWNNHVRIPDQNATDAPIFDDLYNCTLPQLSWVIPDGAWSDHPRAGPTGPLPTYGPSWVGDIIDAVGEGMAGSNCNPHSTTNAKYWKQEPTLILVVWDDWGGWFDHVKPFAVYRSGDPKQCPTTAAPNGWGCGYAYGFRVPLLVVSPWTSAGYVSGPCDSTGCNNDKPPYRHDFGSILAFTEYNFNMPFIDAVDKGYADFNAPDWQPVGNLPLSDFFPLPVNQPRTFTHINTLKDYTFFQGFYNATNSTPEAPDTD
jgi:phosphoesterase family protein